VTILNLSIPGQMTETELHRLMELARRVPPGGIIVEVGCLYGFSSWHISKACQPGVTLFCVDPWERAKWIVDLVEKLQDAPPFSKQAFAHFTRDCDDILIIQGYSPQIARGWKLGIDLTPFTPIRYLGRTSPSGPPASNQAGPLLAMITARTGQM